MFVLIGGGDLKNKSCRKIDEFIIKKSNKKLPNVLFIPTASRDSINSINNFYKSYGDISNISVLKLYDNINLDVIHKMIDTADIIYIGGGNTANMLIKWKEYDLADYILKYSNEKIICGLSAGAICWFDYYLGDDEAFYDNGYCNFRIKKGLGIFKGACCPHYNEDGKEVFNEMIKNMNIIGYAIDNNCALVIENGNEYAIKSVKNAACYKFFQNDFIMKEVK